MGPKSGWGGVVRIGYVRPVQFLDHLTVIKRLGLALHSFKCKGFRCNITIIYSLHCPSVDQSYFLFHADVNSKWIIPLFEVYFYFQIVFEGNTWGHFSIRQIDDGTRSF